MCLRKRTVISLLFFLFPVFLRTFRGTKIVLFSEHAQNNKVQLRVYVAMICLAHNEKKNIFEKKKT